MKIVPVFIITVLIWQLALASHEPWTKTEYPQDVEKLWWDDDWWEQGKLDRPDSYEVTMQEIAYESGDAEIPAYLFRPKKPGKYLPVLFQHGRRGLDDLTMLLPKRLAARGFVVLAPDVYSGRFFERYPMGHEYINDQDVAIGIDKLLELPDIIGDKACVVSHTRGGYMTLRALVTHNRQEQVACYVSSYPHWQDPNQPEPMQVYQYAPEINELDMPVLVFIGEHEQYQRLRPIMEGINTLKEKGRKPQLIVYPGVGRGFDFRPPHVRTFADDLATKDALRRTELFIRAHLPAR
ncbi:MAG: dienelactone hydrolase family protein [Gammaproteobacteria bacterium]|nr:dienelactone hydrolase family protein [Gammaproteobacteria bacterium]